MRPNRLEAGRFSSDDVARFWRGVNIGGPDECWEWCRCRSKEGYGSFALRGPRVLTHRAAYALTYGVVTDCVLHRCDNPPCCNPAHLWHGTRAENSADMVQKGRDRKLTGEEHPHSRFTAAEVAEIRRLYSTGRYRQRDIGAYFGARQSTISAIVRGKVWRESWEPTTRPARVNRGSEVVA
jgi:hypothetical protein